MKISFGGDPSVFWWLVTAVAICALFVLITRTDTKHRFTTTPRIILLVLGVVLTPIIIGQVTSVAISASTPKQKPVDAYSLANVKGLTGNIYFPLAIEEEVVDPLQPSTGQVAAYRYVVSMADLASAGPVSIQTGWYGPVWTVLVPQSKITYSGGAEEATALVQISEEEIPLSSDKASWTETRFRCDWKLHNLWVACDRQGTGWSFDMDTEKVSDQEVATIINDSIEHVYINLTDQQYTQLFPTD